VCWANRPGLLNCSRCEKCIRNQVILAALGVLEHFRTFESPDTLAARIADVPRIRDPLVFDRYEFALKLGLPAARAAAVRALLARSKRALWRDRAAFAREYAGALVRRILRGGRLESPPAE